MGYLLGTILGIPNYKRDPYVHCSGFLTKPDVDSEDYIGATLGETLTGAALGVQS